MTSIVQLATEYRALKDEKEEIESVLKTINIRLEIIAKQELPAAMDDEGVSNITVEGVGKVYLRGEVYVSILADNREAAYQWLRDTGRGSLIQDTVNASSLKAAAKQWLKDGDSIPEDLIRVTAITIAIISK